MRGAPDRNPDTMRHPGAGASGESLRRAPNGEMVSPAHPSRVTGTNPKGDSWRALPSRHSPFHLCRRRYRRGSTSLIGWLTFVPGTSSAAEQEAAQATPTHNRRERSAIRVKGIPARAARYGCRTPLLGAGEGFAPELDFLAEARNVVLVAPQGLGETMLAKNIAHQAIVAGHSALFVPAAQMLLDLAAQESARALERQHGYHPRFKVPAHYPRVPRLGFNWRIGDTVVIKGQPYFALCAHAVMAGGALETS